LIGVISKPDQREVVEEFFQLFKTPWEFYRSGEAYSVVVATSGELSKVNARLLLACGPEAKSIDSDIGIAMRGRLELDCVSYGQTSIPLYCAAHALENENGSPCVMAGPNVVGLKVSRSDSTVIRLGYDLFDEVSFLLANPQPVENAQIPTLDAHISTLRDWILQEGIPLIEILPAAAGYSFAVCLTHDIDFIGIRQHKLDHTMWGFVYRSTVGAVRNLLRGRIDFRRLLQTWRAVMSLPFVYLGWAEDFWEPFEWYLKAERGVPATYFLIPFKSQSGEHVPGPHPSRRASAYDIADLRQRVATLKREGCEIGVHGLDAWHNVEKGRAERQRVSEVTGERIAGIRMHWLLQDSRTVERLEEAGFAYDSTAGYNEAIGYRNGTTQAFRPLGARTLLELPMHIQDGALFYPQRLDLTEAKAERRCQELIDNASKFGGVLTLLWHDRSHGPERFWGDFYMRLLQTLRSVDCWFGTATQVVGWFGKRRKVRFEQVENADGRKQIRILYQGERIQPPLNVRTYCQRTRHDSTLFSDTPWDGKASGELEKVLGAFVDTAVVPSDSDQDNGNENSGHTSAQMVRALL
jgi:peptidoglycan/xylan/chitin deacetylase (PgdA/CDA1 family)